MEAPLISVRGHFSQNSNLRNVLVELAGGVEVLVRTLARWRPRHNWPHWRETTYPEDG